MLGKAHAQVKVTCRAAACTSFAAASHAQPLTFAHARRNFNLVGLGFSDLAGAAAHVARMPRALARPAAMLARHSMPDLDRTHRAPHRFLKRNHDIAFDIATALSGEILLYS